MSAKVRLHKARSLAGVLARDPAEFAARVASILSARWSGAPGRRGLYAAISQDEACRWLGEALKCEAAAFFTEDALVALEAEIADRMRDVGRAAAIPLVYSADRGLARFCYALCRLKRPRVVIETGVSYGITSAYILQAMEVNGCGRLVSIDLPPLGADAAVDVGRAIPERLRGRWRLELGSSRRLLGRLAAEHAPVEIFIHDSLHTYGNVRWELRTMAPFLAEDGVGVCDDIESNSAFKEWLSHERVASGYAIQAAEKADSLFGISLLGRKPQAANCRAHA